MDRDLAAYLVPFALYLAIPLLLGSLIGKQLAYCLMVLAVILSLLLSWRIYPFGRSRVKGWWLLSIIAGFAMGILWLLLDGRYAVFFKTEATVPVGAFLAVRIIGALLIAPLVEELITRDFLVRYLSARDWYSSPIGAFTPLTFIITTLFFGFSHASWLSGLIVGAVFNLVLLRTKNLWSTILAHALSNLVLVVFALSSGAWHLLP